MAVATEQPQQQTLSADTLQKLKIAGLTVWACCPQPTEVNGMVRRKEVEAPLLAALRRDEYGPPLPPLLGGPTGSGKTTLARLIAKQLKLPFYRFQGNDSITAEDFLCVGRINPGGGVEYVLQPVASAVVNGGLCLIDDVDKVQPPALSALLPLLDGERIIQSTLLSGFLTVHSDFRLIFACNEIERLPLWFTSRVVKFRVDYPPVEDVLKMAMAQVPDTGDCLRKAFIELWKQRNGSSGISLSPREAVRIFQLAGKLQKAGRPTLAAVETAMDAVLITEQKKGE